MLKVKSWRDVEERPARGGLLVRRVFDATAGGFESSFGFAQYNRIPPGEANEPHVHDDIEKVYYVIQGTGLVRCGAEEARVVAGDFFFLPARLEHSVENLGVEELQMVVFAAVVKPAAST